MLPIKLQTQLIALYNQPHRHYHNMKHIQHCLREFEPFENYVDMQSIELAIWFHDAIYDPFSTLNELKSAKLMTLAMQDWPLRRALPSLEELREAEDMIFATKNHFNIPYEVTPQMATFLDIDLSILGQTRLIYEEYVSNIIKEYLAVQSERLNGTILSRDLSRYTDNLTKSLFPEVSAFIEGRIKFLSHALSQKKIFRTDHFESKYEKQAKINLANELAEWKLYA